MNTEKILSECRELIDAYKKWLLGNMQMPEDTNPGLEYMSLEQKLVYFTLPMSLNYQRNSYTLWKSVLQTYNDTQSKKVFSLETSTTLPLEELRSLLLKYKIALQPNKHIATWRKISQTIYKNWGSIENLLELSDFDFLKLQDIIQKTHKSGFPYLSWPKIFHYWCYILWEYAGIELKNKSFIEIAPDTHVLQCSVKLWVITQEQAETLSKDEISQIWRELLKDTELSPINMHSPLWFWSRNSFEYELKPQ